MAKSKQLDLTKGSVMKQLIAFAMPILFANVLQHLYNVADKVVVGQFAQDGTVALAAILNNHFIENWYYATAVAPL